MYSEMQVFEFGCGMGGIVFYYVFKVVYIIGIDFFEVMIGYVKMCKCIEGIENVVFEVVLIEVWNVLVVSYDMILGLSVLYLLCDLQVVVEYVFSLLKLGGYFVFSIVCNDIIFLFIWVILFFVCWIRLVFKVNLRLEVVLMCGFEVVGFEVIY